MTISQPKEKIALYNSVSSVFIEQNPDLEMVQWNIKDVPYEVFEAYRQELNAQLPEHRRINVTDSCNTLFYFCQSSHYGIGVGIVLFSEPVKYTHTYTVDKLQKANL